MESGLDRLIPTEALLQDGYDDGELRDIPENRREFITSPEIVLTVKRRLSHLGYLKNFSRDGSLPIQVRTAIREFQTDAGIKVDGWIGTETWKVFEELFTFEMDAHLDKWLENGASRLIHRAVQLRLFAFGLIDIPPRQALVEVDAALKRFCLLAQRMHLCASPLEPSLQSPLTLKFLFDQDAIVDAIARMNPISVKQFSRTHRKEARRFLACAAKIELWLLGYDVTPDGTANFKRSTVKPKGSLKRHRNISTGFFYALKAFCKDVRQGTHRKLNANRFYTSYPRIFAEFSAIRQESDRADSAEVYSETLYESMVEQPVEAEEVWRTRVKSLGGRIWDGLKRVWGWFKRLVKRGVQRLGAFLLNAVRLAWQLARNSLGIVRAAIRSFPRATKFLIRGETAGSDLESIVLKHDADFDWKVFVSDQPQTSVVTETLSTVKARVAQFGFCTRILGLLVQALLTIGKFAVTGYFAIVLALVKIQQPLQRFMTYYLANKTKLLEA